MRGWGQMGRDGVGWGLQCQTTQQATRWGQCPARESGGKNNPACRPSAQRPWPGPGLGSRSYSGAWESYIPWRKAPSQPPSFFPSLRPLATVGPCPAGRGRKGGPRLEEEGGGGGLRAEPVLQRCSRSRDGLRAVPGFSTHLQNPRCLLCLLRRARP